MNKSVEWNCEAQTEKNTREMKFVTINEVNEVSVSWFLNVKMTHSYFYFKSIVITSFYNISRFSTYDDG